MVGFCTANTDKVMSHFYSEFFKFLYIFSFSLGVWTCLNLIVIRRSDPYIRGVLIAYIVLLLSIPINAYLNLIQEEPVHFLTRISQKLSWIYGPLLAIVVNRIFLKQINNRYVALHFVPFLFFFATEQWLNLQWFAFWQYIALLYLQMTGYLAYALKSAFTHRNQLAKLNQNYKSGGYYWAMHLSIGLAVIIALDFVIVGGFFWGFITSLTFTTILASAFAIYINALALLFIYQPELSSTAIAEPKTPDAVPEVPAAQRNIELSNEAAGELRQRLQQQTETHQPHLDPNISLGKLASLLDITSHQLSELLNIHMQMSFYDYLNNLRHEESIKLLQNTQQNYSITDIAYRSGYNNRNSFYKVFKEKTGLTPTQFKSSLRQ